MEWSKEITAGGFGEAVEMKWSTVKSWKSFKEFFEDAVHMDAVTYCESPDLFLELLEDDDYSLSSLDVVVGDREEYQSKVNDVETARRLAEAYSEDRLTVRLKNRKKIHAKMYRAEKPDDSVTLIAGSANLSYNSWRNQSNQVTVFETKQESEFDSKFQEWIGSFREYTDDVFMEDLVEQLREAEDEEEVERRLELWVDDRDTSLTERGEFHSKATDELLEL